MPMAAAATITLYMVRILKSPSLGNRPLRTTSGECRVGVISELLRGLKKKAGLAGTEAKQRAPGQGGPLQTTVHDGLGDNSGIRYAVLASGDRVSPRLGQH